MTVSLTTITGSPQTGLTSPTYTPLLDSNAVDEKRYIVSAIGGTQTGVQAHSISNPFIFSFRRPSAYQTVGLPNPTTGALAPQKKNKFFIKVIKGVVPLSGQAPQPMTIRGEIEIPAGADTADPNSVRAALSAFIGGVHQVSAGLGDTTIQGTLG